jgi:hypothetical protein
MAGSLNQDRVRVVISVETGGEQDERPSADDNSGV